MPAKLDSNRPRRNPMLTADFFDGELLFNR
jgi:hypothetical protein